jgi:hypothetical protein
MPYNCYFEESTTCHHSIGLDPLKNETSSKINFIYILMR